ncbi:MAG: hypothetical protein WBA41_00365 [Rivularia sp. (in: cyanobacteria)]
MEVEIKLTKSELKKISLDFRSVANRLIRTNPEEGISNLKRFLNYIDSNPVIAKFIQQNNCHTFDIKSTISNYPHLNYSLPDDCPSKEISFLYQILKYALQNYSESYYGYENFAHIFAGYFGKRQDVVDKFNSIIVHPFYSYIENYLTKLQIDMGDDENYKFIINGDNYGHNIGAAMTEMNINQSNSSIGVGVNQGEVNAEKLAGTINEADRRNIAEVAAEIQQLLEQLDKSYPTNNTAGKMTIATEVIKHIDNNPTLAARIISALKVGSVKAFEQLLSHPAASFVIGALEDWQKTKESF